MSPVLAVSTTWVGPPLREARLRAGLTREQLARLADCSAGWLGQLESGYQPGASAALVRIWRVLHALGAGPRKEVVSNT